MLISKLASDDNIKRAINNAKTERRAIEHAMFQSEIDDLLTDKEAFISELQAELSNINAYQPQFGYYYLMPKSALVNRYVVQLPFKELVIHYCFVQVIADKLDLQLAKNCFANRLEFKHGKKRLTECFVTFLLNLIKVYKVHILLI